jgi:phage baseplate assembly protein gpV
VHALRDAMKIQAALLMGSLGRAKVGLVSATRADKFAVKVTLQPEGDETGWLPVLSPWVGNGWGLCARLQQGAQVLVLHQENDLSNGIVIGSMFSVVDAVPNTNMGDSEFWLVHKSGSLLKFTDDGKVALTSNGDLDITCGGKIVASASEMDLSGNLKVTGSISATQDVTAGPNNISLENHTHSAVQPGSGVSGPPVP